MISEHEQKVRDAKNTTDLKKYKTLKIGTLIRLSTWDRLDVAHVFIGQDCISSFNPDKLSRRSDKRREESSIRAIILELGEQVVIRECLYTVCVADSPSIKTPCTHPLYFEKVS